MMKRRTLTVLLAVLLMLLAGAAAEETPAVSPELFRGNWELYSISLMGVTLNRSELSYNVVCNIHEDDTAAFALGDSYFVAPVSYEADACLLHEGGEATRLTLDEDGLLCLTMTSDGVKMNLRMQRAAAAVPSAEIAPMVGRWELESAAAMGLNLTGEDTGAVAATIYPDHYGLLELNGELLGLRLQVGNGVVMMLEDGVSSPLSIDAEGRLVIHRQDGADGPVITLTLRRIPTSAEETAATELARFSGVWQVVRTRVMGAEFPVGAETLRLDVADTQATLFTGGAQHAFTAAWSDEGCVLEGESIRCLCAIDADGQLLLQIPVFDITFILARQAD